MGISVDDIIEVLAFVGCAVVVVGGVTVVVGKRVEI